MKHLRIYLVSALLLACNDVSALALPTTTNTTYTALLIYNTMFTISISSRSSFLLTDNLSNSSLATLSQRSPSTSTTLRRSTVIGAVMISCGIALFIILGWKVLLCSHIGRNTVVLVFGSVGCRVLDICYTLEAKYHNCKNDVKGKYRDWRYSQNAEYQEWNEVRRVRREQRDMELQEWAQAIAIGVATTPANSFHDSNAIQAPHAVYLPQR